MHNYKKSQMNFFGRQVLKAAALSSILVASQAFATGLGKLTVFSSLGQPLNAEIELTSVNKEEIASLVPKISSVETFKQANIEFNPALLSLRFAVAPKGSGYVIKVSSTQPMNEPWVDFLLEMKAESGRLVREYTFLLDPADLVTGQAPQVAKSTPVVSAVRQSVTIPITDVKSREVESAPQVKEPVKKTNNSVTTLNATGDYVVRKGDTLMKIASMHSNGVSLDQMLVSIYQANPDAFVGQNMNRLKSGQVLSIPDTNSAEQTTKQSAQSIIRAHTVDFNAYRNKLAGQVVSSTPNRDSSIKQAPSNAITTKVKELPSTVNESSDKLKLSKVEKSSGKKDSKVFSEEDRIAKEKALQDANARVKELEKNVSDLNKLLAAPVKSPVPPAVTVAKPPTPGAIEQTKTVTKPVEKKQTEVVNSSAEVASNSAVKVEGASAVLPLPSPETNAVVSKPKTLAATKSKKPLPPPPPIVEESSWFESPFILPVSGALLALLAGFGFFWSRKKREAHQFEDSILTGSSLKANSMFGSTGGQSVDTNNSVFNSNFAPSASQLDANEVDPVAEADVYIAYGRDTQAEEILKEALRTQPERHAVRLKLLEIYYSRKDQKSFDLLAGELYGLTSGEGDEWAQAASMGLTLDPSNPLYAGASPQSEAYLPGLSLPTQPLEDLETDALLDSALSPDMLDSISIIDLASGYAENADAKSEELNSEPLNTDNISDLDGLDFDLEIAESALDLDKDLETPPTIEDKSLSKSLAVEDNALSIDFASIDFDLDKPSEEISSKNEEVDSVISNEIEIQPTIPAIEESTELNNLEFDLEIDSSIDLISSNNEIDNSISSDMNAPYNAEMATKLDLAVAYQEIGDKDGAKELLDEVIKGGSSEQIEKAKVMLEQLG